MKLRRIDHADFGPRIGARELRVGSNPLVQLFNEIIYRRCVCWRAERYKAFCVFPESGKNGKGPRRLDGVGALHKIRDPD